MVLKLWTINVLGHATEIQTVNYVAGAASMWVHARFHISSVLVVILNMYTSNVTAAE